MVDVTSINIIGEIDTIFNFMQDMNKINEWSLGVKWNNNNHEIIEGISNYDNSILYLKITTKKDMKQITYWIGSNINNLIPRIYVYIIKTDFTIYNNKLSMVAYRTQDMDNERWLGLKESHKKEVKIIKKLIEEI